MIIIKTLPFKLAVIILGIFQIYSIYKNSESDFRSSLISILILIGCIILIMLDIFFKKDKDSSKK